MNWGPAVLLLSSALFFWAFRCHYREAPRAALVFLVLGALVLRAFVSADLFLHEWDERYHALVAKNMLSEPFSPKLYARALLDHDHRNWVGNHIWLHKQPLPLWMMAASMRLFGVNEIALRLPSILLSSMAVPLTYMLGRYFLGASAGFVAAFLMAINGLVIELAGGRVATDHVDVSFMFFVLLSVHFIIRYAQGTGAWNNVWAAVAAACAILSKWLPALIVLPIWWITVAGHSKGGTRDRLKGLAVFFGVLVVVAAPWQIHVFQRFPVEAAWAYGHNIRHFTEVLDDRGRGIFYYLGKMGANYGELIYLPLIWSIWRLWRERWDHRLLSLVIWIVVPILFFSFAKTKMQGYILFVAPALFIITGMLYAHLERIRVGSGYRWPLIVLQVLLLAFPIKYSIERCKPFDTAERSPHWVAELKAFGKELHDKTVLLNYPDPIEAMFYTEMTAYAHVPSQDAVQELLDKGYVVYVNETEDLPPWVRGLDGLRSVRLSSRSGRSEE